MGSDYLIYDEAGKIDPDTIGSLDNRDFLPLNGFIVRGPTREYNPNTGNLEITDSGDLLPGETLSDAFKRIYKEWKRDGSSNF